MRADSARSTLAGKVSERASPALMADQYFRHTWNVFVPPFDSSLSDQLREAARHPSSGATTVSDDAVIVDALLTVGGARDVGEWVDAGGKNLTTVSITYGRGDRWLGLALILDRFPEARAFASPAVIEQLHQTPALEFLVSFWSARFPDQLPDRIVLAHPLHTLDLDGHVLVAVELGHDDRTTHLHVPANTVGVVVAKDAGYGDVHLFLPDSTAAARQEWFAALDTTGAGQDDVVIEEIDDYVRTVEEVVESTATARELYDQLLDRYPERVNPGALWTSARALKP
jgi:hypothetical protein